MSEWQETDFGKIPKEWDLKKIADIKSEDKRAIAMGPFGSNIKAENFIEHGVPVIRGTNFNFAKYVGGDFVYLTEEKADDLLGSNCKAGDIVFTHRGTIGQVGLIPSGKFPRYVISQSGMKLTVNQDLMSSEFLFYFFKSEFGQHQILKYESQVGVPSISNPLTSLKEIKVPVPPPLEQKIIAAVLSSLDDKIDLLSRQNQTLEAIAEALFRQWFVVEAADFKEELLGDFIRLQRGISYSGKTLGGSGEGLPMHSLNSINVKGDYKYDGIKSFIGDAKPSQILNPGDLLIINTDMTPDNRIIGWPIFVPDKFEKSVCTHHLYCLELTTNRITKLYLYFLLRSKEFRNELANAANGTTVSMLSKEAIENLRIKIPPIDRIKEFEVDAKSGSFKKRVG